MKIIGEGKNSTFICEVEKDEIAKVFDHYSFRSMLCDTRGTELKVGGTIDLSAGYDFRQNIKTVCKEMVVATEAFKNAQTSLLKFSQYN